MFYQINKLKSQTSTTNEFIESMNLKDLTGVTQQRFELPWITIQIFNQSPSNISFKWLKSGLPENQIYSLFRYNIIFSLQRKGTENKKEYIKTS